MRFALLALLGTVAWGAPRLPTSDSEIIAPTRHQDDKQRLKTVPGGPALAREYLALGRRRSDPRYFGLAQAALGDLWTEPEPASDVWLLRATLRQADHDFDGALKDLDGILTREPRNPQALLTRAAIRQVQGNYADALADCERLSALTHGLVVTGCRAVAEGNSGKARESLAALEKELKGDADPGVWIWAAGIAAELSLNLGKTKEAEKWLRRALEKDPEDVFTLTALADLLLEQKRAAEVTKLLQGREFVDGLLLRLALAEKKPGAPMGPYAKKMMERLTEAKNRPRYPAHLREEALFNLKVLEGFEDRAAEMARENWKVQREIIDTRLALETALKAGKKEWAREVAEWVETTKLETPDIRELARRAKK